MKAAEVSLVAAPIEASAIVSGIICMGISQCICTVCSIETSRVRINCLNFFIEYY